MIAQPTYHGVFQKMTENLTTVEFKRIHGLSDSSFKRLVSKVRESNPGIELIERRGSKDWVILRSDLLETALGNRPNRSAIVEAEIVDEAESGSSTSIVPFANGYKASSALTFSTTSSQEVADHILEEVAESGNNVTSSLQAFFGATQDQDEQLGLYIGAKRLERVFGTADAIFMQGLEQRAKQQGLGKKQNDAQSEAS